MSSKRLRVARTGLLCGLGLGLAGTGVYGGARLTGNGGGVVGLADERHDDKHAPMHAALDALRDARKHLEEAPDRYGEHKTRALEAIDRAIDEIKDAIGERRK